MQAQSLQKKTDQNMEGSGTRYRIGISGSYGGLNLGDEAILESIIVSLRRSLPVEITVFSRNAEDTQARYPDVRAVAVRKISREEVIPEIRRLDLLILGGGGILFDSEAKIFLREAQIAAEMKVPFMVYAVGAGPLKDAGVQAMVRDVLNEAAAITVREKHARQALEEAGVRQEIQVTADPAFLLEPQPLPEGVVQDEGLVGKRQVVAVSVREPGGAAPDLDEHFYVQFLSDAADFMADRFNADIVFVPMERQTQDVQYSHAVISKMYFAQRASVLKNDYSPGQLLSLFEHFTFAVGMRLHFLIFAALRGVPFVALPYAPKVSGILESMGIDMPTLHVVNAGKLIAYIDYSWDNRRTVREEVQRKLPELRRAAQKNNRIVKELLLGVCQMGFPEEGKEGVYAAAAPPRKK